MNHPLYPEQASADEGETISHVSFPTSNTGDTSTTVEQSYETAPAGGLPNASAIGNHAEATRVESGAGPDILACDVQTEIERTFGPEDWTMPAPQSITVGSAVATSSQTPNL
jgi:hypothetical protein